jgi:hypothetical protein
MLLFKCCCCCFTIASAVAPMICLLLLLLLLALDADCTWYLQAKAAASSIGEIDVRC